MSILHEPPTNDKHSHSDPPDYHVPVYPTYDAADVPGWRARLDAWVAELCRLSGDPGWRAWYSGEPSAARREADRRIARARRRRERRELLPMARELARLLRLHRRPLRRALLALLADEITDIALDTAREVHHAS
jgi:hypothetical protein